MSKSCSPSAGWRRITRPSGRWVQRYGPELEQRLRRHLKPTNKSWRVDETYIRVKGRWCYLYRTIDSTGAIIEFLLSAWRDAAAAERRFRKALSDPSHPQPRVIDTYKSRLYDSAIAAKKRKEPCAVAADIDRSIFERYPGAGSASGQKTSEGQAELSRVPGGPANDRRIRADAHDPQRAGTLGQRRRCSPTESVYRPAVRSSCLRPRRPFPREASSGTVFKVATLPAGSLG
jgi:hypothetical protein